MPDQPTDFDICSSEGDWSAIAEICGGAFDQADIAILSSCLNGVYKTALIEHEYIDKDYRNVYSAHYSRKFSVFPPRAKRVHFFEIEIGKDDLLFPEDGDLEGHLSTIAERQGIHAQHESGNASTSPGYLGYVVVRPTPYCRIGRCLLDPRKLAGIREGTRICLTEFHSHVFGQGLRIAAFPHQSQDTEVHTCAETAVWSLFRYLSQRYRQYAEQDPFSIARLAEGLTVRRLFPSQGLTIEQISAMFGRNRLAAELYDRRVSEIVRPSLDIGWAGSEHLSSEDDFLQAIHICVESGMPPIVGVSSSGNADGPIDHAVVAIGVNYRDKPVVRRSSKVIPATDLVETIVVQDDNWAPYRHVERGTHESPNEPRYGLPSLQAMVVPLPDKAFLAPEQADIAVATLMSEFVQEANLPQEWSEEVFVRKVFLTSASNYQRFKCRDASSDPVCDILRRKPMPHFVWVGELYRLSKWPERTAFAEVVVDATAGPSDDSPFVWMRSPTLLRINSGRLYGLREESLETYEVPQNVREFAGFQGNLCR